MMKRAGGMENVSLCEGDASSSSGSEEREPPVSEADSRRSSSTDSNVESGPSLDTSEASSCAKEASGLSGLGVEDGNGSGVIVGCEKSGAGEGSGVIVGCEISGDGIGSGLGLGSGTSGVGIGSGVGDGVGSGTGISG